MESRVPSQAFFTGELFFLRSLTLTDDIYFVRFKSSFRVEREGSKAEVHKEDVFAKWCVRKLAKVYSTEKKFYQYLHNGLINVYH